MRRRRRAEVRPGRHSPGRCREGGRGAGSKIAPNLRSSEGPGQFINAIRMARSRRCSYDVNLIAQAASGAALVAHVRQESPAAQMAT